MGPVVTHDQISNIVWKHLFLNNHSYSGIPIKQKWRFLFTEEPIQNALKKIG